MFKFHIYDVPTMQGIFRVTVKEGRSNIEEIFVPRQNLESRIAKLKDKYSHEATVNHHEHN
jgi:vacuolar-type H+-ATPase subunit I/STV1